MTAFGVALLLAALAALSLTACGSSGGADLLPGSTASEINSNLEQVRVLVDEGECIGAQNAAHAVSAEVSALGGVDKELKQALREGAERLNEVVTTCEEEEAAEEEAPAIEEGEEAEAPSKKAKPDKAKAPKEEKETPADTGPPPALPPQANGEGKGLEDEEGETPPAEEGGGTGAPSGGVGPGSPAGEE
jgi:TolA-binding protein